MHHGYTPVYPDVPEVWTARVDAHGQRVSILEDESESVIDSPPLSREYGGGNDTFAKELAQPQNRAQRSPAEFDSEAADTPPAN